MPARAFTPTQVREIRLDPQTSRIIANAHGVSEYTIQALRFGRNYGQLKPDESEANDRRRRLNGPRGQRVAQGAFSYDTIGVGPLFAWDGIRDQDRQEVMDAAHECSHGRLPHDPGPSCSCWPQEVLKDQPQEETPYGNHRERLDRFRHRAPGARGMTKRCECGCGEPAAIAGQTDRKRGYVKGQPARFAWGHNPGRTPARRAMLPGWKVCVRCNIEKPEADFPLDPKRPSGLHPYCKPCKAKFMRAAQKRWMRKNPNKVKEANQKAYLRRFTSRTGIPLDWPEYHAMVAAQEGRCAICGDAPKDTLHIDHCHRTNVVRGLLCHLCNVGLGHYRDNPGLLRAAAGYLEKTNPKQEERSSCRTA